MMEAYKKNDILKLNPARLNADSKKKSALVGVLFACKLLAHLD